MDGRTGLLRNNRRCMTCFSMFVNFFTDVKVFKKTDIVLHRVTGSKVTDIISIIKKSGNTYMY